MNPALRERKLIAATIATVAIATPLAVIAGPGNPAHASVSAAEPLATISLGAFEYGSDSLSLSTSYNMGTDPQASKPEFIGDAKAPAIKGDHFLQLTLSGQSSVWFTERLKLSGSVGTSVSKAAGSVGLALRSDGAATHTWGVNITLVANDGKTYTTGEQNYAVNSAGWAKRALPLTTTVPAGVTIKTFTLAAHVGDNASSTGDDGQHIRFDDIS